MVFYKKQMKMKITNTFKPFLKHSKEKVHEEHRLISNSKNRNSSIELERYKAKDYCVDTGLFI